MKKKPLLFIRNGVKESVQAITGVFRSKYIEIIFAVALFILLDTGVLIINFYTSYQIANDAHAIQVSSRMGTLTQSMLNELYRVEEDVSNPDVNYIKTIDILANSYKTFDETLDAFIYGGELIGVGQGKDALLNDTVYRDTSSHLLTDAENIWKKYRVKLNQIVYAYYNETDRLEVLEATKAAIVFGRQHNDNLLHLMQSFSVAVEGVAKRKAERLRRIQSAGITLAVINFFLILFHFLKRLKQSDFLVEKSRKETEDILQNVNEGLFLLDRNFTIGLQHSESLHELFNKDNLAGQNFIELLSRLVSEKTLKSVEEYTEILFSPRVNESLISDLNPLGEVEINLSTDMGDFDIRHFSFQFSRVYEKKEFNTLLVTVKDITEQVELSEQLRLANEKSSKEIDMLLTIIHVENSLLSDFLRTTEEGLDQINQILKKPAGKAERLKKKLDSIARIAHKLKGESAIIGLDFLVEKFHRFEQVISKLNEKTKICGEDFLPLVVNLKQLIADFGVIDNLQTKMNAVDLDLSALVPQAELPITGQAMKQESRVVWDMHWEKRMTALVGKVAKDHGKQVVLDMSDFDISLLPEKQSETVKDIVVQSLRNAVVHGLEPPAFRESSGKSREGNLKVALKKNGSSLQLTIRDDGQGVDLEKIKETALFRGLLTKQQLTGMQPSALLGLLFKPGFTTVKESGLHAGQGVGLDLIKNRVDSLNGQIKLKFQRGQYSEFLYHFQPELSTIQ